MEGTLYVENFIENSEALFDILMSKIAWDSTMTARKTASFGKAYNYSQVQYPFQSFLPELETLLYKLEQVVGFTCNNCLVNLYQDGNSRMGYHSDQTNILETGTGIAIVSLGDVRTLKFRKIANKQETVCFKLKAGSLMYMTAELQQQWQHAIPTSETKSPRMSLTFRQIK